jgi:hypothetical protein
MENKRIEWEKVNETTSRLEVPGGWLYRILAPHSLVGAQPVMQVVFVADDL